MSGWFRGRRPARFARDPRWMRLLIVAVMGIGLTLACASTSTARAGTFTVTTLSNSGFGSLPIAIAGSSAGDTIAFQPGLTGTISLTSPITIGHSLTIAGPGAATITVSGSDTSLVFLVQPGTTVSITGLTIAHGGGGGTTSTNLLGGAIRNQGTLIVTNCVFDSNHARTQTVTGNAGNDGFGGALYNDTGSTLTVIGSTFTNNSATGADGTSSGGNGAGGAIANRGTMTVTASGFATNTAAGGVAAGSPTDRGTAGSGLGGAIIDIGRAEITASDFELNQALGRAGSDGTTSRRGGDGGIAFGGAVSVGDPLATIIGTLTVSRTTFTENSVHGGNGGTGGTGSPGPGAPGGQGGAAAGGALFTNGVTIVSESTLALNSAFGGVGGTGGTGTAAANAVGGLGGFGGNAVGGGIEAEFNTSSVTLTASALLQNSVTGGAGGAGGAGVPGPGSAGNGGLGQGGALDHVQASSASVANSTFFGNSSVGGAGGNSGQGPPGGNPGLNGNGGDANGGALASGLATLTLTNVTIDADTLSAGAAGVGGNGGSPGNKSGGGIYNQSSTVTIANSIVANHATSDNCGGAALTNARHNLQFAPASGCSNFASADPHLANAPADNGGPTQTLSLTATVSIPALNAGDNALCAAAPVGNRDQRGVLRTHGGACDIGAFELGFVTEISPATGATQGGNRVVLSGFGFAAPTSLTVDRTLVTPTSVAATQVTYTAPAHADGTVDIFITSNGTSVELRDAYTYGTVEPAPTPHPGGSNLSQPPAPLPNSRAGGVSSGVPDPMPVPRP